MSWLLSCLALAHAGTLTTSEADASDLFKPRRVAVLVGVDSYEDEELTPLRFAGKDARDLARILSSEEHGDFDQVWTLSGPKATTREALQRAISAATAGLHREDTFLLYLSGHGTLTLDPAEGTRLWFLPADARLSQATETGIPIRDLEDWVSEAEAKRRVLILDTCHNGRDKSSYDSSTEAILSSLRGDPPAPRSVREVSESEARLYAAEMHQPAMEDDALQNGVYTHHLIQALTREQASADLNADGLIDVSEAHDYARDKTIEHTRGLQVPRAEYRIVGREEIYLSGRPEQRGQAQRALLAATESLLKGAEVFVDGRSRGALPELIPLDPGWRSIELRDQHGEVMLRQRRRFRAGETHMVSSLLERSQPSWELAAGYLRRSGPGEGILHDHAAELELAWLEPLSRGPHWLHTASWLQTSLSTGPLLEQGEDVEVWSGIGHLGLSAGPGWGALSLQGGAELSMVWRHFTNREGLHRQASPAINPVARAHLRLERDRGHLGVRLQSRWVPYPYTEIWTSSFEHSLALGWGG